MTKNEEEGLITDLLENDDEFKKAYAAHEDYERKLIEMDKRQYLSTEEQLLRKRLQKMKLSEKDKMETIISKYKEAISNQ